MFVALSRLPTQPERGDFGVVVQRFLMLLRLVRASFGRHRPRCIITEGMRLDARWICAIRTVLVYHLAINPSAAMPPRDGIVFSTPTER